VFNDLLRGPGLREDKLDLAKREAFDGISRRNDEIGEIARREASKLAYGAQNPYVRVPEYTTIAAVNREDLQQWHDTHVHPNNIIIGIVGDFDSAQMEAKLCEAFGDWAKGPALQELDIQLVIGTKSQSTVEAIQALYGQIDELKTKPVTDDEIKRAKDSILNAFVFNFDTPDKVLRERMAYEFYGYPPDFLEKYRAGIDK